MTFTRWVKGSAPWLVFGVLFWKYLSSDTHKKYLHHRKDQTKYVSRRLSPEEKQERLDKYQEQLQLIKLQNETDYSLIWLKENFKRKEASSMYYGQTSTEKASEKKSTN